MRDRAAEIGAPLVLVGIPDWRMLDRAYWQKDDNKRLVESGRGGPDAPVPPARRDRAAARRAARRSACRPSSRTVDADGLYRYYMETRLPLDGSTGTSVAAEAWRPSWQERGLLPR